MRILDHNEIFAKLAALNGKRSYRLMYSSLFGGFVTDPACMILPIDDHMVHRGDGVFEAIRFNCKKIYLLKEHLERLQRSAKLIDLDIPLTANEIEKICKEMQDFLQLTEGLFRLFVSRGPGDFSPNPYTTVGSQIYIVATEFKKFSAQAYQEGVSLGISKVEVKPGVFSQIKSCNYLPNVMMKKESIDLGYDFVVAVNSDGYIAEGPTENVMIYDKKHRLIAPRFDYSLKGTTLIQTMNLAKALKEVTNVETADLRIDDFYEAKEIMMVGTTLGVLPVGKFLEKTVITKNSKNLNATIAYKLNQMFLADLQSEQIM